MLTFKGPLTPEQASGLSYVVLSSVFFAVTVLALGTRIPIPALFFSSCILGAVVAKQLLRRWQRLGRGPDLPRNSILWTLYALFFGGFVVHEAVATLRSPPRPEQLILILVTALAAVGLCGFSVAKPVLWRSLWRVLWWALPAAELIRYWVHLETSRDPISNDRSLPEFPGAGFLLLLASYALYRYSHGPVWNGRPSNTSSPAQA